jgi:hypothetical protein
LLIIPAFDAAIIASLLACPTIAACRGLVPPFRLLCPSLLCPAELLQHAAPGSVDAIVAIGGDGTMHEVLQVRRVALLHYILGVDCPLRRHCKAPWRVEC